MTSTALNTTPLHAAHLLAGAKMVDFGGWDMPLHYGSQLKEHECVRSHAGVFDVSHMTVIDIVGEDARAFLRYLFANDVDKLTQNGRALYSAMLNDTAGVIDDLIVYRRDASDGALAYRVVVNAATRAKDWAWMQKVAADFSVVLTLRTDLAMLAIQGPEARALLANIISTEQQAVLASLRVFQGLDAADYFIARTGYTGEDGIELILPATQAEACWNALLAVGVQPIGLGARDTLRLEAGMNLYGQDMDDTISPLAANMAWTLVWENADGSARDFIGCAALRALQVAGDSPVLTGLIFNGKGVCRAGQAVRFADGSSGVLVSGSFSPTLKCGIAFARVPAHAMQAFAGACEIEIRGAWHVAQLVRLPFVRHGKAVY